MIASSLSVSFFIYNVLFQVSTTNKLHFVKTTKHFDNYLYLCCKNKHTVPIVIGRGDEFIHEEWSFLGGDWYRKDISAIRRNGWDNWESLSQWAYEGGKEEGFYNLEERSQEWLDSLRAHLPSMKRINVLVSHDYMVTPMAVYASDKQIDLHYWVNHKWINYLAGVAIIIDKKGRMTFKVIRGLDSGVLGQ